MKAGGRGSVRLDPGCLQVDPDPSGPRPRWTPSLSLTRTPSPSQVDPDSHRAATATTVRNNAAINQFTIFLFRLYSHWHKQKNSARARQTYCSTKHRRTNSLRQQQSTNKGRQNPPQSPEGRRPSAARASHCCPVESRREAIECCELWPSC